jgi:hypothetical protein
MKSLPRKPFYSLTTIIILLPLLVFCISVGLMYLFGVKAIQENRIDDIFHGFGGIAISLSAAGVLWHLEHRKIIELHNAIVFYALVFGFLCFTVISWEVLEYIIDIKPEYLTYSDTIMDMICGLIGGLFAMFFIRRPVG